MLDQRIVERGPDVAGVAGRATGRRLVRRERGGVAREDEPVHRAEQPERQRRGAGVVLVAPEHLPRRAAALDVDGGPLEQVGVQRRADDGARPALGAEAPAMGFSLGVEILNIVQRRRRQAKKELAQ